MTSLLVLVGLFAAPPDWETLSVPGVHDTARVAFSADGARVAVCAQERLAIVSRAEGSIVTVDRPCAAVAFGSKRVYIATGYGDVTEPELFAFDTTLTRLSPRRPNDVLWDRDRLLVAESGGITVWRDGKQTARHAIAGVRRLARTSTGFLAVQREAVVVLDDALSVVRTLTPSPKASTNGLYDAVEIADGAVVGIDNAGSLWRWDARGVVTRHHHQAAAGRALVWTGAHLVVGTSWFDPVRLEVVARERRLHRAVAPLALSPDGKLLAHPVRGGVLLRAATPPDDAPRGLPDGGRGVVMGPQGPIVADDGGALNWFDRKGRLLRRVYIARGRLRDLVGDPAVALYAGTEWGDVVVYRPDAPVERWPARSAETLALSKDGRTLLVGGQRAAYRFDTRTGVRTVLVETKEHHTFRPIFTPEGEVLVLCSDLPSRLWKADGTVVDWPSARIGAFDARGRVWLGRGSRATINTWPDGREAIAPGHYHWPETLMPLRDGGMIGTDWSNTVVRFTASGAERWSGRPPWHVGGAALDGRRLITTGPDLGVWSWALGSGARTRLAAPGRGEGIHGLVFSADSARLGVAYDYGGVRVWRLDTHSITRELAIKAISDVRLDRVGDDWLVRSGKSVRVWPDRAAAGPAKVVPIQDGDDMWIGNSVRSRGRFLFVPTRPKGYVVDQMTGATIWRPVMPEGVQTGDVSADGLRVAMLIPKAGAPLAVHMQRRGGPPRVVSPGEWSGVAWQGDALWTFGFKGSVLWKGGEAIRRLDSARWIRPPMVGGRRMVSSNGHIARVWEGDAVTARLGLGSDGDRQLAVSPDGRWAATGGPHGGSVVLWDARTGRAVARYEAFSDGVWRSTQANGIQKTGKTFARAW